MLPGVQSLGVTHSFFSSSMIIPSGHVHLFDTACKVPLIVAKLHVSRQATAPNLLIQVV